MWPPLTSCTSIQSSSFIHSSSTNNKSLTWSVVMIEDTSNVTEKFGSRHELFAVGTNVFDVSSHIGLWLVRWCNSWLYLPCHVLSPWSESVWQSSRHPREHLWSWLPYPTLSSNITMVVNGGGWQHNRYMVYIKQTFMNVLQDWESGLNFFNTTSSDSSLYSIGGVWEDRTSYTTILVTWNTVVWRFFTRFALRSF